MRKTFAVLLLLAGCPAASARRACETAGRAECTSRALSYGRFASVAEKLCESRSGGAALEEELCRQCSAHCELNLESMRKE